jgi:hypothetical protein
MEGEINKSLDRFFIELRSKGLKAIAYCDKEEGRVLLLEFMEFAQQQEIALKKLVSTFTSDVETIITSEEGIDENTLAGMGSIGKVIEVDKDESK